VVVEAGLTVAEPLAPNVPTPGILTDVAFVVLQLNALDAPLAMVAGCAVSTIEGGGGELDATATVIEDVAEPCGPVAVATKVVVTVGATLVDPAGPNVPTPEIVTEVAFCEVQLSTAEEPLLKLKGWALTLIKGWGWEV
jgi:hypothetical protein